MSLAPTIITLLTDFGTADGYVGEMKGVLASHAPGAQLVDITHDVPAHDVESGRLALARCWRRFGPGTIHLAVVDPKVGSARRAIAAESDGRFLVGPDNGLLSPALLVSGARVVELPIPPSAAATFHGRDVFAPAAASLATGVRLEELGPPVDDPVVKRTPEAHRRLDGCIEGQVIAVDRFGNAITNLVGRLAGRLEVNGAMLSVHRSYADVDPGAALALVGSTGLLEIAVRDGSGAELFGLQRGSRVVLHPKGN